MQPFGLLPEDIPDTMDLFMNYHHDCGKGHWIIEPGVTRAGDFIEFAAISDCIVALSNCPMDVIVPVNGPTLSPVHVQVWGIMKRVALNRPASFTGAPMLARPERMSDRLLAWVWKPGSEARGAAFIDSYVSEGWNVLEIGCASPGDDGTPAGIVDALRQSRTYSDRAPTIFIADRGTASDVCQAILLAHDGGLLTGPSGLVTVDAFADDGVDEICEELAALENLAAIWAVHREERALREKTLKHHVNLQAQGRETHFLVLADKARSLAQQLTDSRDPLGREMRWLLDPVNSRSA